MKILHVTTFLILITLMVLQDINGQNKPNHRAKKLSVIFDTDANNEIDDQHALAYLLLSKDVFQVEGVTVNATTNGGAIDMHYKEAARIMTLCKADGTIPLIKGANSDFLSIKKDLKRSDFDGYKAVDFIIEKAGLVNNEKLIIIAVGKLTNVALALLKEPAIAHNIQIVWLGSNYPEPGEYNLENDIAAMNYVLQTDVAFEMAVCRYGKTTGTDAVRVTQKEISQNMAGMGPKIKKTVLGRHGGAFHNFGDYSVSLFENIDYYGDPPSRALFDMAAVAIVKNKKWATNKIIPAPKMVNGLWQEQPHNERTILLWENFRSKEILTNFFKTIRQGNNE